MNKVRFISRAVRTNSLVFITPWIRTAYKTKLSGAEQNYAVQWFSRAA